MPIKIERFLGLLEAGEDFEQALEQVPKIVARELALRAEGMTTSEQALDNLALFLVPDVLLHQPVGSRLALKGERAFYSTSRLSRNARVKEKQAAKRQKGD